MAETAGEKTEAPTPKRKEKARDDGQLLKSREFAAALIILIGCCWLVMMGPALWGRGAGVLGYLRTFAAALVPFGTFVNDAWLRRLAGGHTRTSS